MEQILLVVHVFIAVALIGVVLIQRSDQDGFGLGSGSGANLLSGRQSANLFTRATAILATAFMLNSLVLGILAANKETGSLMDQIEASQEIAPPVAGEEATDPVSEEATSEVPVEAPSAPKVPVAE